MSAPAITPRPSVARPTHGKLRNTLIERFHLLLRSPACCARFRRQCTVRDPPPRGNFVVSLTFRTALPAHCSKTPASAPQLPARASCAQHARQRCTREPPIDHVVSDEASRHRAAILRTQGLFRAADRRPKLSQQPPLVLKSCPCPTSNSPHLRHGNPAAAAEVSTSRTQARSTNTRVALPMALRRRHGSVALGRPMTLQRGTGWSTHGTYARNMSTSFIRRRAPHISRLLRLGLRNHSSKFRKSSAAKSRSCARADRSGTSRVRKMGN